MHFLLQLSKTFLYAKEKALTILADGAFFKKAR
jgi:hypothetical protein